MAEVRDPMGHSATSGRRSLLALLFGVLAAAVVVGCGFHLRGAVEIPPSLAPLYIDAPAGSPVRRALEDQLRGSAVQLTNQRADAKLVLRILSERRSSRVAAVDARGKRLAYELRYLVRFDAVGPRGEEKVAPLDLDLVRTFDNPDAEVLGKDMEEELIFNDFALDAADRILMRLRAVLL
jgi:LPS-assembly lipoprotein